VEEGMKNDEEFLRDLAKSRSDVDHFAERLKARGVDVVVLSAETRPDASMRRQYADRGDMTVTLRVEHKVRQLDFTNRTNFPYETVIVDEAYKVREKSHIPLGMYVLENRNRTHAAVVYGWTQGQWEIETIYDRHQGRTCENYVVHKSLVRFCPVDEVFTTCLETATAFAEGTPARTDECYAGSSTRPGT
jgi:hypothetical protein